MKSLSTIILAPPCTNANLHMGHLGIYILCDIYSRYLVMNNQSVICISGADQNNSYTQHKALKINQSYQYTQQYYANIIEESLKLAAIQYEAFIRTASPEHISTAKEIIDILLQNNAILEKQVDQFYCKQCREWLCDDQIIGNCAYCGVLSNGGVCENCCNPMFNLKIFSPLHITCSNAVVAKKVIVFVLNTDKIKEKLIVLIQSAKWDERLKYKYLEFLSHEIIPDIIMTNSFNLLEQYKGKNVDSDDVEERFKVWLLAPIINIIVSEKRLQLEEQSIEINVENSKEGLAAFSKIDSLEMKRALSNLINNAVEALSGKGEKITIRLDADPEKIFLVIEDDGCGIPKDRFDDVMLSGVSLKTTGSGLGLSHAKKSVESWGGSIHLNSTEGLGTKVEIVFPRAPAPIWFVSKISVSPSRTIAILDDDQAVYDAWDQRLSSIASNLHILHFKKPQDFKNWYNTQKFSVQVFSDYELLGESENGLDVLESLHIKNAILVTSHYENLEIIKRCELIGAHLLPKNLLPYIAIEKVESPLERKDL
jgi:anti-sigma regulatory factor (Ser/Thr protein kinase)